MCVRKGKASGKLQTDTYLERIEKITGKLYYTIALQENSSLAKLIRP